jgi:hypothetical protein
MPGRFELVDPLPGLHIGEKQIPRRIAAKPVREGEATHDLLPRLVITEVFVKRGILRSERADQAKESK